MKEKIGFALVKHPTSNIQRPSEDDGGPCSVMAVDAPYGDTRGLMHFSFIGIAIGIGIELRNDHMALSHENLDV